MKIVICLLLISTSAAEVFAQKTFDVQDFSKDFYGKVYLEDPAEVFSRGSVSIYRKQTNKRLIKVDSGELAVGIDDRKVTANIKELPYGEQSAIIFDDFNFDGAKDFAIMDGQNSCYHGPSFKIFLAAKGNFVLDPAFTRLAQEYCGMFEIDPKEKKLMTMTKSGCCWHEYSEFIIVGNKPKAVKIVEEDASAFPIISASTQTWNGAKMVKTAYRTINLEDSDSKVLLSFNAKDSEDKVVLFASEDQLNYVFVNKAGHVELALPVDSNLGNPTFVVDSKGELTVLSFSNNEAVYRVYEAGDEKIGIQIDIKGKVKDVPGDMKNRKGTLRNLIGQNLTNVIFSR